MLRNAFVIVLAVGMLCSGLLSPVNAANAAKINAVAARQAALAQTSKKHHRHHHHKKGTTGQAAPAIK